MRHQSTTNSKNTNRFGFLVLIFLSKRGENKKKLIVVGIFVFVSFIIKMVCNIFRQKFQCRFFGCNAKYSVKKYFGRFSVFIKHNQGGISLQLNKSNQFYNISAQQATNLCEVVLDVCTTTFDTRLPIYSG